MKCNKCGNTEEFIVDVERTFLLKKVPLKNNYCDVVEISMKGEELSPDGIVCGICQEGDVQVPNEVLRQVFGMMGHEKKIFGLKLENTDAL